MCPRCDHEYGSRLGREQDEGPPSSHFSALGLWGGSKRADSTKVTIEEESTSSTEGRLGPRGRRTLCAAAAALVALVALVVFLKKPADSESTGTNRAVSPTEESRLVTTPGNSPAMPSCCYPPPTTVPTSPAVPSA
jgi:hypothetical protein